MNSQNCICGKKMTETSNEVEVQECYASGVYDKSLEKQRGMLCECGLFLGKTGVVWQGKTYPYWKYGSEDIKKIMEQNYEHTKLC